MLTIVVIELDQYRKKACLRKNRNKLREFNDCYEYYLESKLSFLSGYIWHVIEVGNVFATVYEKQDQFVLVSIQFPKKSFDLDKIIEWLDNYNVVLHPRDRVIGEITGAKAIVKGILFKGNPVLLYKKGSQTLKYSASALMEVTL